MRPVAHADGAVGGRALAAAARCARPVDELERDERVAAAAADLGELRAAGQRLVPGDRAGAAGQPHDRTAVLHACAGREQPGGAVEVRRADGGEPVAHDALGARGDGTVGDRGTPRGQAARVLRLRRRLQRCGLRPIGPGGRIGAPRGVAAGAAPGGEDGGEEGDEQRAGHDQGFAAQGRTDHRPSAGRRTRTLGRWTTWPPAHGRPPTSTRPFALVDLGRPARERRRHGPARGRQADPRGEQVGALPARARDVLARGGFTGRLAFTLPEALWLHGHGFRDIVVAYPTVDRAALRRLAGDADAASHVTVMVDDVAQLDLIDRVAGRSARRSGCAWTSTRRGARSAAGCAWAPGARRCTARSRRPRWRARSPGRDGFVLVGLMAYEAQIAGVGDAPAARAPRRRRPRDAGGLGTRARPPARGGGRGGPRRRAAGVRQRRRHRQPRAHRPGGRDHRGRRRDRGSTPPRSSTPTARSPPRPAALFAPAGRAPSRHRRGHPARRRLPRLGRARPRPPAQPHLPEG
jgi:hypothetical protein